MSYINFNRRCVLLFSFTIVSLSLVLLRSYVSNEHTIDNFKFQYFTEYDTHDTITRQFIEQRKSWRTSNVGSLLFKFHLENNIIGNKTHGTENKRFIVLIWRHWNWLKNRHIYNFNSERSSDIDPLDKCSVKNCLLTGDDKYLETADAVVVHLQKGNIPHVANRNVKQRWIFLTDESPLHTFSMAKTNPRLSELNNIFNWSMSYRIDADVPVPYGRTVPLPQRLLSDMSDDSLATLIPHWDIKRTDKLASILISHCSISHRMKYLRELEKYLPLDVHGNCSEDHKNICPGHFRADCKATNEYLFYLVFENSKCRDYLTEKLFYNAYEKGAIPVIMGPKNDNCVKILPPNSFLHVDNFNGPKDLAQYIIRLIENNEILKYHRWRNDFKIVSEHGYFGTKSFHYCRVCEALNYNDRRDKVYGVNELRSFLDPMLVCAPQS